MQALAQKAGQIYRYPVKSAVIEYTYSGNTTGIAQHYIDSHGWKSAQYTQTKTKSFGSTSESNNLVIVEDTVVYSIDLITKKGIKTRIKNLNKKEIDDWSKEMDSIWKGSGYKKVGTGEVLGKTCDIWEGMSTKTWVWQNFVLKTESSMFGKTVMEATRLDLNASIPKDKFKIPEGIELTEGTIDMADPALDSLREGLKKGLEDFKGLFEKKKK
jgi:hypothetical protein